MDGPLDHSTGKGWVKDHGRVGGARAAYKCAHLMIFGRPQVGLDAAVSAGGRGRTPALSARQRRRKFWAIFLYSRHFQLTLRIRISNFYLLLEVPSGPPPRSLDSGRDSPASGALLLGDGEKRQR